MNPAAPEAPKEPSSAKSAPAPVDDSWKQDFGIGQHRDRRWVMGGAAGFEQMFQGNTLLEQRKREDELAFARLSEEEKKAHRQQKEDFLAMVAKSKADIAAKIRGEQHD